MRLLIFLLCLILPASLHAACEGRDLRADMTPEMATRLEHALDGIPFPEGNHWVAVRGDTVMHLIGTLHVNDPRMSAVVERLEPLLKDADAFFFETSQAEMKAFEQALAKDPSPLLITSGPTLIDLMSAEDWAALSATLAKRGIPAWTAAKLRPWFLSLTLGVPSCVAQTPDGDRGMDARLSELADTHGIPQHSLEQVEDVIAMFESHPIEEQAQSLARLAGALEASEDQLATMTNAYLEEKHAEIIQLSLLQGFDASGLTQEEFDAEWKAFEHQLLIQRNDNWLKHILELKNQTAVIAVGAGHLAGQQGLLHQLQLAGFTLTRAPF